MLLRMFSRRWILTTLLVIAAMGVMARLGKWQLDRLEQRRAFNARVEAQINEPPMELTGTALSADLYNMEYREVVVVGEYRHKEEIALRNQAKDGQWGVHLITPLHIQGAEQAVMVDRGWIPAEDYTSGDWTKFAEPGLVEVRGVIRRPKSQADYGFRSDPTPVPGEGPLKTWYFVNIENLSRQVSEPLLPVYVQQAPEPGRSELPARTQPEIELSEGPHLGYALQWFTFALILGGGYPFFIRRQEREKDQEKNKNSSSQTVQAKPSESSMSYE